MNLYWGIIDVQKTLYICNVYNLMSLDIHIALENKWSLDEISIWFFNKKSNSD